MIPSPPDPSNRHDPLLDVLREAQAMPDSARAQALEDRLTARLQQLTSQSERKSPMQAQMVYTRRPSAQPHRLWNNLAGVVALVACAVLVTVFFPRPTPPNNNNIAAPIGVEQDPTIVPLATILRPTSTPFDGGSLPTMPPMTATPLPGAGSSHTIVPLFVTPTPTAYNGHTLSSEELFLTPTPLPFDNGQSLMITVPMERLLSVQRGNVTAYDLQVGQYLEFYLPVVTAAELPESNLMNLVSTGMVELVPIGMGRVIESDREGNLITFLMDTQMVVGGESWLTTQDSQALIVFTVLPE